MFWNAHIKHMFIATTNNTTTCTILTTTITITTTTITTAATITTNYAIQQPSPLLPYRYAVVGVSLFSGKWALKY